MDTINIRNGISLTLSAQEAAVVHKALMELPAKDSRVILARIEQALIEANKPAASAEPPAP
jgi:hypothetical protein